MVYFSQNDTLFYSYFSSLIRGLISGINQISIRHYGPIKITLQFQISNLLTVRDSVPDRLQNRRNPTIHF